MTARARTPAPSASRALRLLLVDDRPQNLEALEAVLAPLGLPLVSATSGREALRLLLEHDFAVILLDVRMPGIDGLQTARLIKRRERTRHIPIVFLTAARDDVQDVLRGYEAGAVDYVLKPFDAHLLRTKVAILIELQRSRYALQRSEGLLRGAFDSAPTGMTVLDGEHRIVRANPTFARMAGRSESELEAIGLLDLCHPDDGVALIEALARPREPGPDGSAAAGVDLRLRAPDGSDSDVGLVVSVIDPGAVPEPLLLGQWVDRSARRRAEQTRAELLLEHSARVHAEAVAERLHKLQTLSDGLASLSLEPLLAEVALRVADLFDATAAEVRVGEHERRRVVRAAGGELLDQPSEGAWRGLGEWIRRPMRIDRLGVGELAVCLSDGRSLGRGERSLLHEAADRAALAIRQAQLFEEEHRIAVELQRGLLPKRLPRVAGVELAAHYRAAGAGVGAEVGGDWYDAFALSDGRVGVVIGDVAGRGIAAASTMGQLRAVTRALALQDGQTRTAGDVLTRLNRYQMALEEELFVTVLYAIVDPSKATVAWCNAGHLPPLLRQRSGEARYLSGGAYPLGTEDIEYQHLSEPLATGCTLLLFTDGLVERRGESIDAGLERLAEAVRGGPSEPHELCEHVLAQVLPTGDRTPDDVTAVIAQIS